MAVEWIFLFYSEVFLSVFIGRKTELEFLNTIYQRKKFGLVTIQGRRRIGKSTLIHHFAKKNDIPMFEFQGLPPRENQGSEVQRKHFLNQLAKYMGLKSMVADSWEAALMQLKNLNSKKKAIILLDEISWMSEREPDFQGFLKNVCDHFQQENLQFLVILCGSVSSWIQKNILNNTGFVGRISGTICLEELSLDEIALFFSYRNKKMSKIDVLKFASLVGGVPKYLEEVDCKKSIELNLKQFFFSKEGFFFQEFEHIFSDIFGKKNQVYKSIIECIKESTYPTIATVAEELYLTLNGNVSEYFWELEQAGFIKKYPTWNFSLSKSKLYHYRICDNYALFYLIYLNPYKEKITQFKIDPPNYLWPSAFGRMLENLIYRHPISVLKLLNIDVKNVEKMGPYFRASTKKIPGVQIDLLIQCKKNIFHIIEIKSNLENAVPEKKLLNFPKHHICYNHLLYLSERKKIKETDLFDSVISIEEIF